MKSFLYMSNKTYDVLKIICMGCLPLLATFVLEVTEIWGIPHGAQIGATITALATLLGGCLLKSSELYKQMNAGINADGEKFDE